MTLDIASDDYCPLLTCLKSGAHSHPVCEACGAVNYGSLICATCRGNRPAINAEIQRDYADWKAARTVDPEMIP